MRYIEVEQEEREFETPVKSSTLKSDTFPPKWSSEQKIKIMPLLLFCFVSILIIVYEYKGTRNVQVDTKAIKFNEPGTKAIEFNESDIEPFSTSTFLKSFNAAQVSVLFVHVPKAGGISVQKMLRKWAHNGNIELLHMENALLKSTDLMTTSKPKVFIGHGAWRQYSAKSELESCDGRWVGDKALHQPLKVVVLRDPINRLVSNYDFVRHHIPRHHDFDLFEKLYGNQSLDFHLNKMLDDIETNGHWSNDDLIKEENINSFSRLSPKASVNLFRLSQVQMSFLCPIRCRVGFLGYVDISYKIAISNLQHFHVIAILENLDSTLLPQLKYWLPWADKNTTEVGVTNSVAQLKKRCEKNNKHQQNNAVPFQTSIIHSETRERLKRAMKLEYELYEKAKNLATERLNFITKKG